MIRTKITRNMPTSEIHAHELTMAGDQAVATALPVIIVGGRLGEVEAMRHLRKIYGRNKMFSIKDIIVEEGTYEMSIDDFLKYATKINQN